MCTLNTLCSFSLLSYPAIAEASGAIDRILLRKAGRTGDSGYNVYNVYIVFSKDNYTPRPRPRQYPTDVEKMTRSPDLMQAGAEMSDGVWKVLGPAGSRTYNVYSPSGREWVHFSAT